jgi:hypothetical protein
MIRLRPPYLHRVFDAVSQLLNTALLDGNPNDSISGRAHKQKWVMSERLINFIFFWEPEHCYWAYMNDLERARKVLEDLKE